MRNRFNQQNRNNLMVELENRGVKLSVVEKSRAQILETK